MSHLSLSRCSQLASLREALRPGTLDGYALLPRLVPDPGFAEAVTVQVRVGGWVGACVFVGVRTRVFFFVCVCVCVCVCVK